MMAMVNSFIGQLQINRVGASWAKVSNSACGIIGRSVNNAGVSIPVKLVVKVRVKVEESLIAPDRVPCGKPHPFFPSFIQSGFFAEKDCTRAHEHTHNERMTPHKTTSDGGRRRCLFRSPISLRNSQIFFAPHLTLVACNETPARQTRSPHWWASIHVFYNRFGSVLANLALQHAKMKATTGRIGAWRSNVSKRLIPYSWVTMTLHYRRW